MAEDLKHKTAKGLTWGLVNNGTTQLLNLVFGIVLARLLTPADYGIVGVLTVFTLIAGNLQAAGFITALCNERDPQQRDYDSVFWFNITMSALLYGTLFLCAPLLARFFHAPQLLWLSRFVFLTIPISALSIIANAYMFRQMMVRETAVIGIAALLLSGSLGITLAYMGASYWALAWQQVAYSTVITVGRYLSCPLRPTLHFSIEPIRRMFAFSMKMMVTTILNSLSAQVLTFIFGRLFPLSAVGIYSQANKWNTMAGEMLRNTVAQVAQPVMAQVRDDGERALRVLRKMMRFSAFVSFPAMFGLALVSPEFILTAIGQQWLPSVALLRILALAGSTLPLYATLQYVAISHGRSDIFMWMNVVQVLTQILIVVAMHDWGIERMVQAVALFWVGYLFAWYAVTCRLTAHYRLHHFLLDTLPFAVIAAGVMGVTYVLTASLGLHHAVLLCVRIVLAALLYAGFMLLTKAEIMRECVAFVRKKQ